MSNVFRSLARQEREKAKAFRHLNMKIAAANCDEEAETWERLADKLEAEDKAPATKGQPA